MELTTSYQKISEAYLGTDDYGANLYVRLYMKYSEQDSTRSKVQYQARAYLSASWYIYDEQGTGTVSGTSASTVTGSCGGHVTSDEVVIATTEAWVTHNSDGTKSVSGSAYLNYPNWGWSNTTTGNATLPTLSSAPSSVGSYATKITESSVRIYGTAESTGCSRNSLTWEVTIVGVETKTKTTSIKYANSPHYKAYCDFDGLLSNSKYNYTVKVTNNVGLSTTVNGTFTTAEKKSSVRVGANNVWVEHICYVGKNNAWVESEVYVGKNNAWVGTE